MNMYITLSAGGHQYRVKSGDKIVVNRIAAAVGETVTLERVLMVEKENGDLVAATSAQPSVGKAEATVEEHFRGEKLRVFKMRRRKKSRRMSGHRQDLTRLKIGAITDGTAA